VDWTLLVDAQEVQRRKKRKNSLEEWFLPRIEDKTALPPSSAPLWFAAFGKPSIWTTV
jgi:hypothetical protein